MKKVIPFKKEIKLENDFEEILSIALEHTYKREDLKISGEFIISGEYKSKDKNEPFVYNIPFQISLDDKYILDNIDVTIDDFYYENYPLIIKRKGCHGIVESYQIPSHIEYVLPKSLFVGDDGEILIGCLEGRGIDITRIKYNINDKYIYLTKLAY